LDNAYSIIKKGEPLAHNSRNFLRKMAMDKITLSTTLVNNIMAYLGTRPFQEVFQLIQEVQKEAQAQPSAPTTPETPNV
jgi:hypothetical protein